jgi:hypothetical protein
MVFVDQNVVAVRGNYRAHHIEHPWGRIKNCAVGYQYMSTVIYPLQIT